jgi:hypothetical protein
VVGVRPAVLPFILDMQTDCRSWQELIVSLQFDELLVDEPAITVRRHRSERTVYD